MKKIITILLAFVYLMVSSGLIMELHHCMGKLAGASVSLFGNKHADKCDNCGMENGKNKCCNDELKLVKIQDSQKQASVDYSLQLPAIAEADIASPILQLIIADRAVAPVNLKNHPPAITAPSLSILHCVFRV